MPKKKGASREVIPTQEVMGSEGSVSGAGGGAYRLVRSRSLNFFPIKASALSTCCCVPGGREAGIVRKGRGKTRRAGKRGHGRHAPAGRVSQHETPGV